jgi:hypothetical protein
MVKAGEALSLPETGYNAMSFLFEESYPEEFPSRMQKVIG